MIEKILNSKNSQNISTEAEFLLQAVNHDIIDGNASSSQLGDFKSDGTAPQWASQLSLASDTVDASPGHKQVNLDKMSVVNPFDEPDSDGKAPLHLAVELGTQNTSSVYAQFTRMLLNAGAYVNVRDKLGKTPAHYLIDKCSTTVVVGDLDGYFQMLETITNDKYYDSTAKTFSNYSLTELLEEKFAEHTTGINNMRNFVQKYIEGEHNPEEKTESDILRILLSEYMISFNYEKATEKILTGIKTESEVDFNWYIGSVPFITYVTTYLDSRCVERILELGANPWILDSSDGKLALHAALEQGFFKTVEILLHYMHCSRLQFGCDLRTKSFTLLQKVICNNNINGEWNEDVSFQNCLRLLLNSPLNLDVDQRRTLYDHTTLLDLAVADGNTEAIRLFKQKGGKTSPDTEANSE